MAVCPIELSIQAPDIKKYEISWKFCMKITFPQTDVKIFASAPFVLACLPLVA
jgi:hypothetical protein